MEVGEAREREKGGCMLVNGLDDCVGEPVWMLFVGVRVDGHDSLVVVVGHKENTKGC